VVFGRRNIKQPCKLVSMSKSSLINQGWWISKKMQKSFLKLKTVQNELCWGHKSI
jgi:hypothetical protein